MNSKLTLLKINNDCYNFNELLGCRIASNANHPAAAAVTGKRPEIAVRQVTFQRPRALFAQAARILALLRHHK